MTCPRCTEWHRRAQAAEAAIKITIEQCRREGVSLGRTLANAGYRHLEERITELETENARLRAFGDTMTTEIRVIYDLRDQIAQCHAELAAMDETCARLTAENASLQEWRICDRHRDVDGAIMWGCPDCLAELRHENAHLRAQLAADAERLRAAERLVWGEVTFGCDGADHLADEILSLRAQLETQALEAAAFVERVARAVKGEQEVEH